MDAKPTSIPKTPSSDQSIPESSNAPPTVSPNSATESPTPAVKEDSSPIADEHANPCIAHEKAARVLQGHWRARKGSRAPATDSTNIPPSPSSVPHDAEARWDEMNIQMRSQVNRTAAEDAKNDPAARWRRAGFVAARLQDGNAIPEEGDEAAERVKAKGKMKTKTLETQHWLELIDGKHRYGSNLKFYFRKWLEADTEENFFFWLDRGGGKDLDLEECSREQLEKERITYLSAEQRRNYLVQIDENGLLRWARNGVLVDTRPGEWKNAEGGQGIVPLDGTEDRAVEHRLRRQVTTLSGGPSVSSSSLSSVGGPQHYDGDPQQGKIKKAFASRFTSKGITDRLLKKTMKKNTWIYASDTNYNVFVGVKKTGSFQHSSLTGGGLITSAGLIKVKDGQITSLSPLSGHYRTSIDHFNAFLEVLEARGADLHKVQRTKAEIALWGLSRWKQFKKNKGDIMKHPGKQLKKVFTEEGQAKPTSSAPSPQSSPVEARKPESEAADRPEAKSDDHSWLPENWKQDVLTGRRQKNG